MSKLAEPGDPGFPHPFPHIQEFTRVTSLGSSLTSEEYPIRSSRMTSHQVVFRQSLPQLFRSLSLGLHKTSGEKLHTPPAPPRDFGQKAIFKGEGGGGVHFEAPPGQDFYAPPLFYTPPPPTPRRVFSGVGRWGCIKSGPPKQFKQIWSNYFS